MSKDEAGDDSARARETFAFLRQVCADPEISPSGFKLAFVISQHINRKTGVGFPSQETLAREARLDERSVRRLIDLLRRRGHLVVRTIHRWYASEYRLLINQKDDSTGHESPVEGPSTGHQSPLEEVSTGHQSPLDKHQPDIFDTSTGLQSPPNQPIEPTSKEESKIPPNGTRQAKQKSSRPKKARPPLPPGFAEWWLQYPRKVGKADAEKEYSCIVADGEATEAELLAGVMRYAAAKSGDDPKYVKYPAGWLRDKRWTDEPESKPQGGINGFANTASATGNRSSSLAAFAFSRANDAVKRRH